jgi:Glycosyl hydrolases family 28
MNKTIDRFPCLKALNKTSFCMKYLVLYCCLLAHALVAQPLNISDFGAKGDGLTLNTKAIQAAIERAAKQGGGVVSIPAGRFLSGTLFLKTNIELHLSPGAVLLGSTNLADYDSTHRHLMLAENADNVALTGTGKVDGQGYFFYDTIPVAWTAKPRPLPWILIKNCTRVRVRDVQLHDSPAHVLVLEKCADVVVDGISIRCDPRSPNTDGLDITDSRNVMISNCFMQAGDDLICLKSHNRWVENVTVTNCVLVSDDAAIKFGTGSTVGVRNSTFSNISIYGTRYGLALFMIDGGTHEHCLFENITIRNQSRWQNDYPIFIDIHQRDSTKKLGRIKDIQFRGISIQTGGNILVAGQPGHPLEDLVFEDINMTLTDCNDVTQYLQKPRGNKTLLPIVGLMDYAKTPANFTFAHINGLRLDDITLRKGKKVKVCDRAACWFKDIKNEDVGKLDVGPGLSAEQTRAGDN